MVGWDGTPGHRPRNSRPSAEGDPSPWRPGWGRVTGSGSRMVRGPAASPLNGDLLLQEGCDHTRHRSSQLRGRRVTVQQAAFCLQGRAGGATFRHLPTLTHSIPVYE